jgi:flagellin
MGFRVNTNVAALNAQRNLVNTTTSLNRSLERLSSGLRITRAADDAAGLALSEGFRAEIRGLVQAQRNGLDGISLLQVAEGALNETSGNLIRMRELAIQSANGTLGTAERGTLDDEFQALMEEISRIANVTTFNGTEMINDDSASIVFQVGINNTTDDVITVTGVDATATGLGINALAIDTVSNATAALATLDTAIADVAAQRGSFGTAQNRLESTIRSLAISVENASAAESRIRDVDVAAETANLTRLQVLQQAGVAVLAQANVSMQSALSLLQ